MNTPLKFSPGPDPVARSLANPTLTGWMLWSPWFVLGLAGPAQAGKLSWLDDVVREVIAETRAGGKSLARGGEAARGRAAARGAALPLARRRGGPGATRQAVR